MDTYIVRIYRREENVPQRLVGLVEEVGVEEKRAFSNLDELWNILSSSEGSSSRKGRRETRKNPSDKDRHKKKDRR